MLITLLVFATIIGFILAVAKILDVPLQRLGVDNADNIEEASHEPIPVIVEEDPPAPVSSEPLEVPGPVAKGYEEPEETEEPERRRSRLGAGSRLLVLVLAVAASVALVIVVLIEWMGGIIEKALS